MRARLNLERLWPWIMVGYPLGFLIGVGAGIWLGAAMGWMLQNNINCD